jgi:transcriptional antiterminator NusG
VIKLIYALRTLVGQEKNVARLLSRNVKNSDIEVTSILVPDNLRGYILVESAAKIDMQDPAFKVPNLRGSVEGEISFEEIKSFLNPEPIIASIKKGSIVELITGPFKGERAKVVRIDEPKEEVVLELIEAAIPIPVTVKGDQIRLIQKEAD